MASLFRAFGRQQPAQPAAAHAADAKAKDKDKISLNTAAILARHDTEQALSSPRVEILGISTARSSSPRAMNQIQQQPTALPPLHEAVIGNNAREVNSLVSARNRIEETDAQGSTALHVAASLGNGRLAEVLIRAGASVNAKNHLASTPLHLAALNGHRKVLKLLIKAGAKLEEKDVSGNTPLLSAALAGHFKLVQTLVEAGAAIMATNAEGNTGLHYASSVGDLDTLLLYLMTHKITPDLQNNERSTPLHYACSADQEKCAEMLIEWGALPGAPDKSLATPLHCAARHRGLACVRLLIGYNVDVNAHDKDGLTALHQACMAGSLEIVERLIKGGARINTADSAGETPLHKAAMTGFASIVSTLIEKDAVTDCTDKHHRTPLYVAARSGHTRCVELFLNLQSKKNVNVLEITDTKGRTPLHAACTYGRWETTFLLLQMGAFPNAQDSTGLAPLHEAAINGDDVSMSFLISKRCNLLLTSNDGLTALHLASLNGHLRCVQLLIEQGVAVDISDAAGDTPLHYAVKRNNVAVAAFLLHSKAPVSPANKQGLTPLHYAVRHGAIECVVRLVEAGADIAAPDRDKITPYIQAKREGDPQMRLIFKFLKKNNHQSGIGRHVFHDFRRLRAPARPAEQAAVASASAEAPAAHAHTATTSVEKTVSAGATITAKQRAAYAAVTKAPPALLSPKRVLTDVNFNDLAEVVEVVQSEASKQDARAAYAAVLRLLLLVPDDPSAGAKVLHVLEQAMSMVLHADPRKAARMDTEQFLDALRKKSAVDEAARGEGLLAIERALPQLFEERRAAGAGSGKTPRGAGGKSPRNTHAISPRGAKSPRGAAAKPPPPPPPPPLKLRLPTKVLEAASGSAVKPAAPAAAAAAEPAAAPAEGDKPADGAPKEPVLLEPVAVAPPPPPAIKAGPPPPPMMKGVARSAPVQRATKLRKLNWEKVPIGIIPKTVWSQARPTEFPASRLEEEFQERDPKAKGLPPLSGPIQKRQIVDLRRANQVGVLMAAVKAPPHHLREMIMKGEDNAISEDALRSLIRLVPKDEEIELLQPYKGQPADVLRTLGQAERLYLELMDVPRLKPRLEALLFRRTFPTEVRRLKERTQRAFNGINQLRTAPKLRQLLELILSIGNYLNEGTAVGQALGFRLEALQKLDGTRSPVKKDYSLLNFIVAYVMDQRPQLTTLEEELTEVRFARLEEINDIVAEEAALRAQVDSLSAELAQPKVQKKDTLRKTLVSFEATVRDQSRELTERLTVMRTAYEELLVYYAAERGADVATFVLEFVKMFKRAEMHIVRAREVQAAKERAKELKANKAAALAASGNAAGLSSTTPRGSRKRMTFSKTKLQSAAPNLQVKLAMEGKPQTFANPLMDIDLDRVARRRSRTLSPEIASLLTARENDPNAPSKSPRRTSGRDAIQQGATGGGMSRSPSLNSTRDVARGDSIVQPAEPAVAASAKGATARKRMTLGRRVMNPILSIFSISPSHAKDPYAPASTAAAGSGTVHGAPLTRSVSVGPLTSNDTIPRSTSTTSAAASQQAAAGAAAGAGAGRRKRRERPIERNTVAASASIDTAPGVKPLRASSTNLRSLDEIKGKERMDPRDQAAPPAMSRTSSASNSSPVQSPHRRPSLRRVGSKDRFDRVGSPAASPPMTDRSGAAAVDARSAVDSQPARQHFAKLRPVEQQAPLAAAAPAPAAPAAASSAPAPAPATAVAPEASRTDVSAPAASSAPGSPLPGSPVRKEMSTSTSLSSSPRANVASASGKKEGSRLDASGSKIKRDQRSATQEKRRSTTFGIRLQPVPVDEAKRPVLAPAEIQRERTKVIARVRERTAKEAAEGVEKKPVRTEALATPSAAVFPPELMQEVKVEDLLKEQFTGEKENALLIGEMPLLAKKRHSVNVTELFGLHMQRSPSQDAFASQRPLSARSSQRNVGVKTSMKLDSQEVDAQSGRKQTGGRKGTAATGAAAAAPATETPAEEQPAVEQEAPVSAEALRQLKALYPHLLDSVLESLLRSADGDVEQATLYLQKKGWVSQEPTASAATTPRADPRASKKPSAFSTLRNLLGGKKNPFSLPGEQPQRTGSKIMPAQSADATKRKGVKF